MGTDTYASDLDIVVNRRPDASCFKLAELKDKLGEVLGVKVDLIAAGSLPEYMEKEISETAYDI